MQVAGFHPASRRSLDHAGEETTMHSFPHVASKGDDDFVEERCQNRQMREAHNANTFPGVLAPAPHRTAHTDP